MALADAVTQWAPALAALATATILIGNLGAIAQRSLKRMLAWSGVAQAGYLLAGVVVGTKLGLQATAFYLAVYLFMNVAAFAVVLARERVTELGDDIDSLRDLGRASPWLAWPMTIAMFALAGIPGTAGFIGKFYLIDASVAGDYAWLGVAIVVGSMISLVYYLRVIAVMWMGRFEISLPTIPPRRVRPVGGWSPEADARAQPEVAAVAILAAAATIVFGIVPSPLFDLARDVGSSFSAARSEPRDPRPAKGQVTGTRQKDLTVKKHIRFSRPTPALAIACIALFVAMGGVSYGVATGSIDSREIKNGSITQPRLQGRHAPRQGGQARQLRRRRHQGVHAPGTALGADQLPQARSRSRPAASRAVDCYRTNANCYIDAGENVTNNGVFAEINASNTPVANRLNGETGTAPCGLVSVNCAPPGTETPNIIVVAPRNSDGSATTAGNRFRFYVYVTGSENK